MLSVRAKLWEENQMWNRITNDTWANTLDVVLRKGLSERAPLSRNTGEARERAPLSV